MLRTLRRQHVIDRFARFNIEHFRHRLQARLINGGVSLYVFRMEDTWLVGVHNRRIGFRNDINNFRDIQQAVEGTAFDIEHTEIGRGCTSLYPFFLIYRRFNGIHLYDVKGASRDGNLVISCFD